MIWALSSLWPLGFLTVAVCDDLLFRKFHNWLFLSLTAIGFLYIFIAAPLHPSLAVAGFLVGGALMLPLTLFRVVGAGDMKFMMCFGILIGPLPILAVFVYSLFWGGLLGLLQSLFGKKIGSLANNLHGMLYRLRPHTVQKIPYTVAIFLGWVTLTQWGGVL